MNTKNILLSTISIIGSLLRFTVSAPVLAESEHIVKLNLLQEKFNTDHRAKRYTDSNMADHLSFSFPLHNDNVELRLTRSRLLPTVTSDVHSTDAANKMPENAAVYTDVSQGSAVIVNKVNSEYSLEGSFIHGNKEWTIVPHVSKSGINEVTTSLQHRISPIKAKNATISFVGDTVIDNEARPQLINELLHNKKLQKHDNKTRADNHRQKRSVTQHVIEIAFVVDYEDYTKWQKHVNGGNPLPAMRLWYTYVAESVNVRYQSIKDPHISIRTRVTILKILNNPSDSMFITRLANTNGEFRGSDGLTAFRKWYPTHSDIPISDHYMLFTGYDIMGSSGIAVSSRACTGYSVSISENSFSGSVGGVAAHELGHSLSALHDTDTTGPNACTDSAQYIMSTVFTTPVRAGNEGNPWKFSPCSVNAIKTYLGEVTCTLPENTSGKDELPFPIEGERAGQVNNRNEQCVLSFRDSRSFFCQAVQEQNGGLESICGGMYCSIPDDWMGACQTTVPQEFTSCGTDMWCVSGQCIKAEASVVEASTARTTLTTTSLPNTSTTAAITSQAVTSTQPPSTSSFQTTTTSTTTATSRQTTNRQENTTDGRTSRAASISSTSGSLVTTVTAAPSTTPTTKLSTTGASGNYRNIASINTSTDTTTVSTENSFTTLSATPSTKGLPTDNDRRRGSDVTRCRYLIFLRRGTEWWNCVQRELRRCERRRDPPGQIGRRVYLRWSWSGK